MSRICMSSFWPLLGLLFTGCSSDFDGTWLFQWDLASTKNVSSEACTPDEARTKSGDEYEWIDIYTTTGGALVLTNGEQEWVGTASGDSFKVSTTYGESDASYYYQWSEEISADLAGDDLSGQSDEYETTCDAEQGCTGSDDECRRQTRRQFKGIKMEGTSGAMRTISTQSGQSSS